MSAKDFNNHRSNTYWRVIKLLHSATVACGIWKSVTDRGLNVKLILFYYTLQILVNSQLIIYICFEREDNVIEKSEGIQFFAHMFHDLLMYIFIIKNHKFVTQLIIHIELNFRQFEIITLRVITGYKERTDKLTKEIIRIVFAIIVLACLSHTLAKLFSLSLFFPIYHGMVNFITSSTVKVFIYAFLFIFNLLQSIVSIILNMCTITYTVSFILIISTEFDILMEAFEYSLDFEKSKIFNLSTQVNYMLTLNSYEEYQQSHYEMHFKKLIKHHLYLLKRCKECELFLSMPIIILFLTCELMLCFCSFQLYQIYGSMSAIQILKHMSMVMAVFSYGFSSFWFGQHLASKITNLRMSMYNSTWYNGSLKYKSNVNIFLTRTVKPFVIKAGKIIPVTIPSFITALKAAFSYFNLLCTLSASIK